MPPQSIPRPELAVDEDFPSWFKSNPINVIHLDTDVVLTLRSQNTNVQPHFDTFSQEFARVGSPLWRH
jgi:hypothetical protein